MVCVVTAWPPRRQQIKQVQREYHAAEGASGRFEAQSGAGAQFEGADAGGVELPAAEIANLEEIAKVWGLTVALCLLSWRRVRGSACS